MKWKEFVRKHKVLIFSLICIIFAFLIFNYIFGIGWWYYIPFKERCGGWDLTGETICECSGMLIKPKCPPGALCDGGTYYCIFGKCGECMKR